MACALSDLILDKGTEHFLASNLEIVTIDVGNKASNVTPETGYLKFNIRFNTNWTMKSLDKKLREVLDPISKNYELETGGNAHPFITEPNNFTTLVKDVVTEHTNKSPKLSTSGGTSDARFISNYCPVVEFGLTNETIHQIDECLKISDLEKLTDIYAGILNKLYE